MFDDTWHLAAARVATEMKWSHLVSEWVSKEALYYMAPELYDRPERMTDVIRVAATLRALLGSDGALRPA